MLHHQRVARAVGQRGGVRHDRTDRLLDELRRRRVDDPVVRDHLVRLYIGEVCQSLLVTRSLAATTQGSDPGPIGSLGKLSNAIVARQFADLVWRIVGSDAVAWAGPPLGHAGEIAAGATWAADALFTLSLSIAGGTNEIQRSIVAERVLGLPVSPPSPTHVAQPPSPASNSSGQRPGASQSGTVPPFDFGAAVVVREHRPGSLFGVEHIRLAVAPACLAVRSVDFDDSDASA